MKKLILIVAAVFFGTVITKAEKLEDKVVVNNFRNSNSFIFAENGVTFSVYPDGEFDFFIDNRVNVGIGARVGNVGLTFNSGYNYNPFVQYDDYGAIIQVENVPVFYDYYGRVSQIGGVDVWYRNGLVRRVGGLNVFYNGRRFSHYTGFVNIYNRNFVYRPYFRWFARPAIGFCNVWTTPYRRWYNPVRYSWYRPYRNNVRRAWVERGRQYRFNRTRRANIYRNDNRVAVRENRGRRSTTLRNDRGVASKNVGRNANKVRRNSNVSRSSNNRSTTVRNNNGRKNNTVASRSTRKNTVASRSNRGNSVTQRSVTRTPRSTTVTKREVTRTPQKRTVSRKSTTYKKPQSRSVASNRGSNKRTQSVQRKSTPQKRTVSRSASTRRSSSATSRTTRGSRRQ